MIGTSPVPNCKAATGIHGTKTALNAGPFTISTKGVSMFKTLNLLFTTLWFAVIGSALYVEANTNHAMAGNILHVWANDGGDKVTRDELRAKADPSGVINSIWTGNSIQLFGARNEVVGFNLVLEAPMATAADVSVAFDRLTGPGGAMISSTYDAGTGIFDWVHRNIELFYIRYLEIKGLSITSYGLDDERQVPERMRRPWTGEGEASGTWGDRPDHNKFYPDIAVPLELEPTFDIHTGENQSIWVDIFIPKTAPPGTYQGTIAIQEGGNTIHLIPVVLSVKDFGLPDLPSARTMVYSSWENINFRYSGEPKYPEPGTDHYVRGNRLFDVHLQVAHRHKISLIGNPDYTPVESMDEAWTDRLNGDLFTHARGYDGPGIGTGNNVYVIAEYGKWPWKNGTKEDMWINTDAWVNWFDRKAFKTETDYFLYLEDESVDYPLIEKWAKWIKENPGPGSRLKSMATLPLPTALEETLSLDIPASSISVGITDLWQNAFDKYKAGPGKQVYFYNGARPGTGSFAIEDDGVALRVVAWAQYKKKIDRWFYWESTYYDNFQGEEGEVNVFQKAQSFGSFERVDPVLGETGYEYSNGNGVLFYPGTDQLFTDESYNVSGPFASIRLKLWRRGIQDVDYLTMAARIDPERTAEIVNRILPRVLWEYGVDDPKDPSYVTSDISWPTDPDDWEAARAELAEIIVQGNPCQRDPDNDCDEDRKNLLRFTVIGFGTSWAMSF